jgi:ubiquinone/menaquinone biosynthesis C-methylase UbiE
VCGVNSVPPMANPTLERIIDALQGADRVLDIGCGNGALSGALAKRGFRMTGVDPQADRIAQAKTRFTDAAFAVATAEALPFDDGNFDAAVFLNALHHVPKPAMADALSGALHALRPGGVLIVVEPLAEGSFFEAMRPVDDETAIRAAALRALDDLQQAETCTQIDHQRYDRPSHFPDLEAFLAFLRAAEPERDAMIEQHRADVAQSFATHAAPEGTGFALAQPMAIWVFQTRATPL